MTFPGSRFAVLALGLPALWLAAPRPVPTSGNVLVVVANGPYPTVQAAVDAAVDGDVILVRPGHFPGFVVANKSIVVLGDLTTQTRIDGSIHVVDLAAERTVVLSNLVVKGTDSVDPLISVGLHAAHNDGRLRVEACAISGADWRSANGAYVLDCRDVSFVGCDLVGGTSDSTGYGLFSEGLAAAEGSQVTLYGSVARGGDGAPRSCSAGLGHNGGDGGDVRQSSLFTANSSFVGGDGGDGSWAACFSFPTTGDGGHGVRATGAAVRLFDSALAGGDYGHAISGGCGDCLFFGYAGDDRSGSTFSDLLGSARLLSVPAMHAGSTTATITLRGIPGDEVLLLISKSTITAEYVPAWRGMLFVPQPGPSSTTRVVKAGVIPANGVLATPLALPVLAPGAPAHTFYVQALFGDAQQGQVLSGARSVTLLP